MSTKPAGWPTRWANKSFTAFSWPFDESHLLTVYRVVEADRDPYKETVLLEGVVSRCLQMLRRAKLIRHTDTGWGVIVPDAPEPKAIVYRIGSARHHLTVELRSDEPETWGVYYEREVFNKRTQSFVWERRPSGRTDAHLRDCRFDSLDEALRVAQHQYTVMRVEVYDIGRQFAQEYKRDEIVGVGVEELDGALAIRVTVTEPIDVPTVYQQTRVVVRVDGESEG